MVTLGEVHSLHKRSFLFSSLPLSLSPRRTQTQRRRADWFDLGFCGPLLQPESGGEDRSALNSGSARARPSLRSFKFENLQIGSNLCFALAIIDLQSCMANGDE